MADYWKSQPKKFCDYCKCWIADNRPSIDFHERGKNHKENVAKRISEIRKKSMEKAKEEENMSKEFAAMEEAAMKAYQEDLKRLGIKPDDVGPSSTQNKTQSNAAEGKKEKKEKKEKKKKTPEGTSGSPKTEWVQGLSPEGYTYYYNTKTGESQWEKPKGFQGNSKTSQTGAVWVEGVSEDGHTYYYNTQTGVSTWEKPDGFVSSSNENSQRGKHSKGADSRASESDSEQDDSGSEGQSPGTNSKKKGENDEESEKEKSPKAKKLSSQGKWREVQWQEVKWQEEAVDKEKIALASKEASSDESKTDSYGKWKAIKNEEEEEEPGEKVDLELPSTEGDSVPPPVLEVPEDSTMIFKEKTVTSLGDLTEGVPTFKKRKFENGKSRNLRQRLDDQ